MILSESEIKKLLKAAESEIVSVSKKVQELQGRLNTIGGEIRGYRKTLGLSPDVVIDHATKAEKIEKWQS